MQIKNNQALSSQVKGNKNSKNWKEKDDETSKVKNSKVTRASCIRRVRKEKNKSLSR